MTRRAAAFTMIELLMVISIIAVLAALLLAGLGTLHRRADQEATAKLLEQVMLGLQTLRLERGAFPDPDPDPAPATPGSRRAGYLDRLGGGASGVYDLLSDRGLVAADLGHFETVAADRLRLLDRWRQPVRYLIAYDPLTADDQGHQPAQLRTGDPHFEDWNHLESQVYVYSYGPDNADGGDYEAWIFPERGGS